MSNITASPEITEIRDDNNKFRYIQLFFQSVLSVVNGNIEFSRNIRPRPISVVFSSADTDVIINHGLKRVPRGYLKLSSSAAMNIYNGSNASTSTQITLRSDAAGTAVLEFL
jgi:hypothetical protein